VADEAAGRDRWVSRKAGFRFPLLLSSQGNNSPQPNLESLMPFLIFLAYLACVPLANWMIGHAGTVCVPQGPCLIPVGFGLMAPSGVVVIGAALVLRDIVQRVSGVTWALGAIAVGTALSWWVADPHIAMASAVAFLISELADCAVYSPLQRRGLVLAVVASGIAGAVVDSGAFLWLAFGSLDFLAGQVVGKAWAVLIAVPLIVGSRRLVGARA
jgi:uncharacterized PurR-regulated membrane protein YhhQ (DUF165 family)